MADYVSRGILPTCGVSECDRGVSIMKRLWSTRGCFVIKKYRKILVRFTMTLRFVIKLQVY